MISMKWRFKIASKIFVCEYRVFWCPQRRTELMWNFFQWKTKFNQNKSKHDIQPNKKKHNDLRNKFDICSMITYANGHHSTARIPCYDKSKQISLINNAIAEKNKCFSINYYQKNTHRHSPMKLMNELLKYEWYPESL